MEKGLLCTECNFVCHKKCYSKSTWKCRGRGQERPFGSGNLNDSIIGHSRIAPLVEKCISHMELKGLYTEGIYRKAGSEAKVKELKHRIKTTGKSS
ncbi:unconventional myosin-IXb-like [Saccoglossus kowalevskii]